VDFNGDLCNAAALCEELGLPTGTHAEAVIASAWRRWTDGMFERLEGTFALVLRDHGRLILYRDPSGIRSLYVRCAGGRPGGIDFATDPQDLPAADPYGRKLSRRSLHEYLGFLDITAPNTIYENVWMLEPGRPVQWSGGGFADLPTTSGRRCSSMPADFAGAIDELDKLLQRAVQHALNAASAPAVFLSGGIDSSLITALSSRTRADVVAVTVGFDGARYDEAPLASRIAAHLGVRHEVLRYSQRDFVAAFERLGRSLQQPMADPATPATVLVFDHCRQRYDVVLDGTGADEAVGATPPRHLRFAVQFGSLVPRLLRGAMVRVMRAVPGVAGYTPLLDFEHPADTMIRWHGFTRREIEELCGEPVSFEHTQFYRTFARFPRHAHFERYGALLDTMPSDRLSQAELITGMTARYPFFDVQTNRYLRQLRTDWRYLPGQPKRILRELLARYVPREIWDLPKHGFDFPLTEFLTAQDFELVRRHLLDSDIWQRTGLLSVNGVRRYATRFIAGDRRLTFRVWALVVLGAWLEKHPEACST
jgi:asparagine synthase (glutamine-hydrolysing)